MDIRILGPLEVLEDGRALELGGTKQRAVLAMLALQPNRAVSMSQLAEAVWDDEPPESARKALQVYVSQLRKVLGRARLQTRGGGYLLQAHRDELDLTRFEHLRDIGELDAALALWRGEPLADLADHDFVRVEAARLEELRLACLELRIERDLAAGRHGELAGELEALVREHPHREHLRAQLMLALYRAGRQAEALEAYQAARSELVAELGLDPGPELRNLHQQILRHDPTLDRSVRRRPEAADTAAPSVVRGASMRKTVTVLFCDLAGSTELGEQLDPEALRTVMTRWYEAMRAPVERAGGTVEKFIGDAVMAVFGVPAVHEDDAFRAVQAAIAMRDAALPLGLQVRIGVNTGEVVTGDSATTLVTGDAVNTAKRLEEAATPGEILIGAATRLLVANATELEPADPVSAKGKRAPLPAWRVLSTIPGATPFARRLDVALVGRTNELGLLNSELDAAVRNRECRVVTIHGSAGVGKSRLAQELLADAGRRVQVLQARCVPYGDGITFLPLRELLAGVGGEDAVASGSSEEIFLSVRRLLEEQASKRPILVCIEDVHWAQPTFLDLIEYLAGWSSDAPILIVCLARPELYDSRPRWPGVAVALDALSEAETSDLLDELAAEWPLAPEARAQISDVAEGNPLFLEQLVAMLAEDGTAATMPPTIQALLAARLDRLEPEERAVLQRAAVAGRDFSRSAVADLSAVEERGDVGATLLSLVRKELVRPAPSDFPDEDGFRFRHALIRDAAYGEIPKRTRIELHERFASWLERREATPELVGYHLEQAYRSGAEIGVPDEAIAARAGELLAAAGRRAYARDDVRAAVNLLRRASTLVPPDDPIRPEALILLGSALMGAGEFAEGRPVLVEARDLAQAAGDRRLEIRAAIELEFHTALTGSARSTAEIVAVAEAAIPVLLDLHDYSGLSRAWRLISEAHVLACRWADRAAALERALHYAQQAGDRRQQSSIVALLAQALHYGPTPVEIAIERCEGLLADAGGDSALAAALMSTLGGLYAMRGDAEHARSLWSQSRALYEELGLQHRRAVRSLIAANIELLGGDAVAAERELRLGYDTLAAMGETWVRATLAAYLGAVLAELGRNDEAITFTRESETNASADDVVTQVVWRGARARALAHAGEGAEAAAFARDAVRRAAETDFVDLRAGAFLDLAAVLAATDPDGAADAAAEAAREYERKGNVVGAERARSLVTV
jgi:DNA-binding SARP family transcriptional activator/predicted ATPase